MLVVNVKDYGGVDKARAAGVKYCGRPTPLGNPFSHLDVPGTVRVPSREEAVACHRLWLWRLLRARDEPMLNNLRQLAETDVLGCWCAPLSCHAHTIVSAWLWCRNQGLLS